MSSKKPPPKPSRAPEPHAGHERKRQGTFELPPLPIPPPRRRFASEPPTRQKNVTASVYQSLISVFDTMTPAQGMEFVDAAALYAKLDAQGRRDFLALIALYPELSPADRTEVGELIERLTTKSKK